MFVMTFAAAPTELARAATLLVRRDNSASIQAIQCIDVVTIDTGDTEGLVTVEYNGTDALVVWLLDADAGAAGGCPCPPICRYAERQSCARTIGWSIGIRCLDHFVGQQPQTWA